MTIATINRLITLVFGVLDTLSGRASMGRSEQIAMLVQHSMDSRKRTYHTTRHVFDLCQGMQPRQVLAALFHDVVYYQLDGGFAPHAGALLHGVVRLEGDALILLPPSPQDHGLRLCVDIFGLAVEQPLPLYGGMNEFLSAVVAMRALQDLLDAPDLVAVLACIEATIPFRAPDAAGITACERLALRVRRVAATLPALHADELADAFVQQVVADAVALANRDVGGFSHADPGLFLSSTWLLIEESNAPLTAVGMYSLQDYRRALVRMSVFLAGLNPAHVFQSHAGVPDAGELTRLGAAAAANIDFAVEFLDAKIMSIAIIEALALCTGADCPVAMFLGDIRSPFGRPQRVEDFLPQAPAGAVVNPALLQVFEQGRSQESNHDLTASPLTAYVYRYMGHAQTRQALLAARAMFDGQLLPQAFLQQLNADMLGVIIGACANIAVSRSQALRALQASLAPAKQG